MGGGALLAVLNVRQILPRLTNMQFVARRDRALAIIVLSVQLSLLYLIGDHEDPIIFWQNLADQFQKKTWANKPELRRKL